MSYPYGGYRVVTNNTVNVERLRDLTWTYLDEEEARWLARRLCRRFKLKMPKIVFSPTRSNSSGMYRWIERTIFVGPGPQAEVICHELSHHYQYVNNTGLGDSNGRVRWHTKDGFVPILDRFAKAAEDILGEKEGR